MPLVRCGAGALLCWGLGQMKSSSLLWPINSERYIFRTPYTAHGTLHISHRIPRTAHCRSKSTACTSAYRTSYTAHRVPQTAHRVPQTAHRVWHIAISDRRAQTVHPHIVQRTQYIVHDTPRIVQRTQYIAHGTPRTADRRVQTAHPHIVYRRRHIAYRTPHTAHDAPYSTLDSVVKRDSFAWRCMKAETQINSRKLVGFSTPNLIQIQDLQHLVGKTPSIPSDLPLCRNFRRN